MVPNCVPEETIDERYDCNIYLEKESKKVKGISKDTLQHLQSLPTPVITSLINQIGMIVSQKEELGKDADVGDYVKDFRKSDAPQFKGKSDKKIQKMIVVGTYL